MESVAMTTENRKLAPVTVVTTRTVAPEGMEFTPEQRDLLRRTMAKDFTDDEFTLFQAMCQRTGLDPFARQIYAIKRRDGAEGDKLTIQTSIDGYRLIADRTGCYAGGSEPTYDTDTAAHPGWAKITVYKFVGGQPRPFTAKARWEEFCPIYKGQPASMWKKMPYHMLAKVSEAHALRKAFPQELSGVYTHEEMQQADSTPPEMGETEAAATPDSTPLVVTDDPIEVQREALKLEIKVALTKVVRPLQHAVLFKAIIFHCFHCAWDVLPTQSLATLEEGIGLFRHLCGELAQHGKPDLHPDQWIGAEVLRLTSQQGEPRQEEEGVTVP